MRTIALVTEQERPQLSQSDSLLVAPLQARGITATALPWDAPGVAWDRYDALVLRSCWLYHQQAARFAGWLAALADDGVPLWNPAPAVQWNMDKAYLRDLAVAGVPIIPTVWLEQGATVDLAALLAAQGWATGVIKPRVGASAFHIWHCPRAAAADHQPRFQAMLAERGVMVQPLVPEIAAGEWSLVFFGETFSHAVLKRPAAGEIFVQQRLGGSTVPATPPPALVEQAARALRAARQITGTPLLYARVDGLVVEGHFWLMELELIEPGLFLPDAPRAADRFADAIVAALQGSPQHDVAP